MTISELQNQLLELKRSSASNSVAVALMSLQQELARPPPVFDPYRALAGLESLVDLAQDKADEKTKRFSTQVSASAVLSSPICTSKVFFSSWLNCPNLT